MGNGPCIQPNMNRLSKRGGKVYTILCRSSCCSPSRAATMTGKTNYVWVWKKVPKYQNALKKLEEHDYQLIRFYHGGKMLNQIGLLYPLWMVKCSRSIGSKIYPNGTGVWLFFGHQRGCIITIPHLFNGMGPNKSTCNRNSEEFIMMRTLFWLMTEELKPGNKSPGRTSHVIYLWRSIPHIPIKNNKVDGLLTGSSAPRREYPLLYPTTDEKIRKCSDLFWTRLGLADKYNSHFQSTREHLEERAFGWLEMQGV